uniref:Nuclear transcription factor Y subunit n=1 Tax=Macrostomum lignano TaxID=282301 RepID=A0A1I8FHZ2_9PLAT
PADTSGARYYNPFLRLGGQRRPGRWRLQRLERRASPLVPASSPRPRRGRCRAAAAAGAAAATLSPDHRARVCPDQIDSSEETALKQEAYSARLTAHWDSQFGVQDAIEAYFKSQIVAPSSGRFRQRQRRRPEPTGGAARGQRQPSLRPMSTQTILSIPASLISPQSYLTMMMEGRTIACGEPAADWAAESSPH